MLVHPSGHGLKARIRQHLTAGPGSMPFADSVTELACSTSKVKRWTQRLRWDIATRMPCTSCDLTDYVILNKSF